MNLRTTCLAAAALALTLPLTIHAQTATSTIPADFYQFLLQQQANQSQFAVPTALAAPVATTTTPTIEDVVFQKNAVPVTDPNEPQIQVTDRNVALGDEIIIGLTSQKDSLTPIDLFVLAFDAVGFPTKRVFLKTVFNEQTGITKKYRIAINQDLLTELAPATSMRIGYCIGGCKNTAAKLIIGKVILPASTSVGTTTPPGTQRTF